MMLFNIFIYFIFIFFSFQRKYDLILLVNRPTDYSNKCHVFFSLKNNIKQIRMLSATFSLTTLIVNER